MKLLIAFVLSFSVFAQVDVVSWDQQIEHFGGNKYEITLTATITDGWYIYSKDIQEGGPLGFSIEFEDGVDKVGDIIELGQMKRSYSSIFNMDILSYEKTVTIRQIVESSNPSSISGYFSFMACNGNNCLPPEDLDLEL